MPQNAEEDRIVCLSVDELYIDDNGIRKEARVFSIQGIIHGWEQLMCYFLIPYKTKNTRLFATHLATVISEVRQIGFNILVVTYDLLHLNTLENRGEIIDG